MNAKKSKSIFKLLALVIAFALTVLFIPVGELVAWARIADEYVDYSYIKIGEDGQEVKNTIYTGDKYYIPKAYIGNSPNHVIGDGQTNVFLVDKGNDQVAQEGDVTLVSSSITVTYGGTVNSEGVSEGGLTITYDPATEGNSGSFFAERLGTYTITYAYTYSVQTADGAVPYTNFYDMKVVSSISSATIELDNNSENLFPSIIDASLLPTHEVSEGVTQYDDVDLPIPTVYGEDGEEVENLTITTDVSVATGASEGDYLVVTMTGGANADDLTTDYLETEDLDKDEVIDNVKMLGTAFDEVGTNYSSYTVKYAYYHNGQFVASTTKTATVYNKYYTNYSASNLTMELDSSLTTSAQPGIEQTLPGVTVTTNSNVSPSAEEIEVYYKIKVKYRATGSSSYKDLDPTLYNAGEEDVIDGDGYLIDPTTFTPLEAGSYTFNYVAYDFYGNAIPNENGTADGRYQWTNITDTTAPTAIVYDASAKDKNGDLTYEEASDKLARYTYPNGVVVYAVGLEDNLTTVENATLSRVVYANSEELFTIKDYDNKNLVFNYRASSTDGNDAWEQLMINNYLIRKAVEKHNADEERVYTVEDNATMLRYLRGNGYLIVIDNGGTSNGVTNTYARSIYNMFTINDNGTPVSIFNAIEGVTDADSFIAYLHDEDNQENVKAELEELGFAYIATDRTFGAQSSNGGFSYTAYQIRYVAQDEAGNSNYISREMTLTTTYDTTPPTLSLSTNFEDTYNETDVVDFAVPTASDDNDTSSRMKVQTYYRFLTSTGDAITNVEEDGSTISTFDNSEIFDELRDDYTDDYGTPYSTIYASYQGAGYINLTDSDASTYSIDLALGVKLNAASVQIFAFVYDDYGNVGIIGEQFDISSAVDEYVPTLKNVEIEDSESSNYWQGNDISLPTVTAFDDNVDFMNYNVSIYNVQDDGSRISLTTPSDSYQARDTYDYTYSVYGGTFNAAFAGDYVASIELSDYNNTKIVVFTHYTVRERLIIQDPVANVSFEDQTVELDDDPVITLPTPTISYSIDNSLDYETYKERDFSGDNAENEPDVVLIGVDENGYATNYSITNGLKSSFTPTEKGVYTIQYTTRLRVYSTSVFEYFEGTYEDVSNNKVVNYFTELDETYAEDGYLIKTEDESSYRVFVPDAVEPEDDQTYTEFLVYLSDDETSVVTEKVSGLEATTLTVALDRFEYWQENLRMYVWESDNFTVTVNDTTGPVIKPYDYVEVISSNALKQENTDGTTGYKLEVQGIQAEDASGINYERSSVSVTRTYKVDGSTRTSVDNLTDAEKIEGKTLEITTNGTVTISYTVYDNNGNSSTAEYVIRAGDNTNPVIRITAEDESDFIGTTYSLSDFDATDGLFIVDLTQLTWSDDKTLKEDLTVTYEFVNDDTSDEPIEAEVENENQLAYLIEEVGNYTFTITVTDEAGNATSREFSFEVTEETYDATITYRIIGTVLIVISVLLLAGVIIYFVVSKVKLDKELKK